MEKRGLIGGERAGERGVVKELTRCEVLHLRRLELLARRGNLHALGVDVCSAEIQSE